MPSQPLVEDATLRASAYSSKEYFDMLVFEKKEPLTAASMQVVMKMVGMQWNDEVRCRWREIPQMCPLSPKIVCWLQEREDLVGASGMPFEAYRDLMKGGNVTTGKVAPQVAR